MKTAVVVSVFAFAATLAVLALVRAFFQSPVEDEHSRFVAACKQEIAEARCEAMWRER